MNYMDEIDQIVADRMDRDDYNAMAIAAARMLCLDLFLCSAGNGPDEAPEHIFLTASNHPALLQVMASTNDYKFTDETSAKLLGMIMDLLDDDEQHLLSALAESIKAHTYKSDSTDSPDLPPDRIEDSDAHD